MSEFKPLIAGKWLKYFAWTFSTLALISLTWFMLYISNSKRKVPKTTITGIVLTSLLFGIALQLIMIQNNFTFK